MLTGLGHRAVRGADHQNRAVHLGGTGDHVFDVVRVTRAVNVRIVALGALVLDVGDRDGDRLGLIPHGAALGDVFVLDHRCQAFAVLDRDDRRRESGLAVVDVTDRAHVHVRLRTIEVLFSHVTCYLTCSLLLHPRRLLAPTASLKQWSPRPGLNR